jgi:dual specificity protein kinase YAK1
MNNRIAFTDFVRGLLTINPLERWSPQQAKFHPFITQQKFTQPFVPPMNLKSSSANRTPAPGVQQQQQAEALSKQRAQAAQAAQAQAAQAAQLQAQSAAQSAYANMQMAQYSQAHHAQPPPMYGGVYPTNASQTQGAPPPYPSQTTQSYGPQMGLMPHTSGQLQPNAYGQPPNLYAQVTTRAGRQRASTMDQQQGGIPPAIQRVASHLDPNAPIRLQPSPAYYPPPPDGAPDNGAANSRRRSSRAGQGGHARNRDFIRNLEDRTLEEGFMNQSQWH